MTNESDITPLRALIVKDFGIETFSETNNLEELTRFIALQVEEMLRNDMSRLMSILYRVDVLEPKVKKAFAETAFIDLPMVLAALILERELQKAESRKRLRHRPDSNRD